VPGYAGNEIVARVSPSVSDIRTLGNALSRWFYIQTIRMSEISKTLQTRQSFEFMFERKVDVFYGWVLLMGSKAES
jgi:hypothetical protein